MAVDTPHEAIAKDAKQLPVMSAGKLIGREAILAKVYTHLKANEAVLLYGAAGAGRTALAATLASAYVQQPAGVLWMNVDEPRLEELLVRVGRAYGIAEIANADTPLGMVGAVENTLRTHKPFIVIDGTIDAGVLSRFISRCADGLPLLIVAPEAYSGPWETVHVPSLQDDQAAALFKREGRVAVNEYDDDVFEIVQTIGTSPLSVIIAARAMVASKQTPDTFLKLVGQVAASSGATGVTLALTVSFRALNNALQGLMLIMGALFPNGATGELLSMVSGAQSASVEQAMNILTQLHMVERTTRYGGYHYRMHPVVYQFAHRYLSNAGKLDGLRQKAQTAINDYADKYADAPQYDKLAAEMDTFLALALWAQKQGDRQTALDLAAVLNDAGDFAHERGYVYDLMRMRDVSAGGSPFPAYPEEERPVVPVLDDDDDAPDSDEYAVDEDALEPVEDDDTGARRLYNVVSVDDEDDDEAFDDDYADDDDDLLGMDDVAAPPSAPEDVIAMPPPPPAPEVSPEDMMSEPPPPPPPAAPQTIETMDDVALRNALGAARQSGDTDEQIALLKEMSARQVSAGMDNEAIAAYTEVLSAYESIDDQEGILEAEDMLSALMVKTANPQPAIMHAARGVRIAQSLADDITLIQLYMTLGDARQLLGESGQAIQDYSSALTLTRRTDDQQHEAIVLFKLGYAQLDDGDAETAIDTLEQALALFKAQEKRDYEGRVMGGLGSAFSDLQRWSEAMRFHTSALYIAREVGDQEEEALQLNSLAYAAVQAGELGDAVLRYRQALYLALVMEDKDNIVSLVVDLARLLLRSKSYAAIAGMLIDAATQYEPNDRDLVQLRADVEAAIASVQASGKALKPAKGSALDYAQNAYQMLSD
ncbi:MAG: tetratricopeptide repeat protein [Anaerolineaceae bacterium]|nr:MAG: tetratricopeptide repeat protein [Anaerolineaceae bacterium]